MDKANTCFSMGSSYCDFRVIGISLGFQLDALRLSAACCYVISQRRQIVCGTLITTQSKVQQSLLAVFTFKSRPHFMIQVSYSRIPSFNLFSVGLILFIKHIHITHLSKYLPKNIQNNKKLPTQSNMIIPKHKIQNASKTFSIQVICI